MKLRKIGVFLCLTAMAGIVFNIGAAACTPPAASKGTGAQQQVQSPYTRQWNQPQFSYSVGTSQKQQPQGFAYKAPSQKNQSQGFAYKAPSQKQQPQSSAPKESPKKHQSQSPAYKAPSQKQQPKGPASWAPYQKQQPKAPDSEELAQVQAQRKEINTLNAKVLSLKAQARKAIITICVDLAKVASDPDVRKSQDYKTIVDRLGKVKTKLADAEKIDYCSKLASVKGRNDASSTLTDVIAQLNTKISDLTAVVDDLKDILSAADALVKKSGQPTTSQPATSDPPTSSQPADEADQKAWQQFLTQAYTKKKTIDSNTQQLAAVNKSCQDVVNEIVATAAANQDVLANQGSGMAGIVVQLGTVKTNLAAESNDKIAAALKVYAQDVKKQDYAGALDELDAVIGIQNDRIKAVQSALSQLQSTLTSLQNLVATAAASSSSAVSSQAA